MRKRQSSFCPVSALKDYILEFRYLSKQIMTDPRRLSAAANLKFQVLKSLYFESQVFF